MNPCNTEQLFELDKKFKNARNLDQLNQTLEEYLKSYGITMFAFTYHSYYPNSQNKLKYDYSTSNFAPWHKHYNEQNYEEIDSTLDVVYRTNLPTYWNLNEQLKNAKNERERQMRLDSIAFGTRQGLSIPIHGPHEDFAILVLVQMHDQNCLDDWQRLQYGFFTTAYYYYSYVRKILLKTVKPVPKHQLNQREIQCLTLIAKQYSIEAIATTLNITQRTVNYHIQRLNKKLGAQNKYQAVIKALNIGLIQL